MTDRSIRHANYRGDQQDIVYDGPKGPSMDGSYWDPIDTDYDQAKKRTRVTFRRVVLTEPAVST